MIVERLEPSSHAHVDTTAPDATDTLLEWYRPASDDWMRINLVASVNGKAAGSDGTSETLTAGADRRILGIIRRLADTVLVGAASVRAEGYVMPRTAKLVIVTASGDLTGHALPLDAPDGRITIITGARGSTRLRETLAGVPADIITLAGDPLTVTEIVTTLRARGHRSIVCEGGPSLAASLIDAGLIDELCLTTAPVLTASPLGALPVRTSRPLALTHLMRDDAGMLYSRWAVAPPT